MEEIHALVRELLMGFLHVIGVIEQGLEARRLPGVAGGTDGRGGNEFRPLLPGAGTAGGHEEQAEEHCEAEEMFRHMSQR